ncbi:MAG: hypothetical protein Q8P41_25980 [Pseudomonadota bacterium]|nr:hypothetical protein [Pseudomonadota bacterium]
MIVPHLSVPSRSRAVAARALFPREHGLWCWVAAPLVGAALLAPSIGSTLAALSVLALFGAGNAARASAWGPASAATATSAALGIGALPFLYAPGLWILTLALLVVGGAVTIESAGRAVGRKVEDHTRYELGAIGGFVGVGAAIAVAAGTPVAVAAAVGLALLTWQVTGLWWVRGQLARVLTGREPWRAGAPVVAALTVGIIVTAFLIDAPLLGAVPALYAVRARLTRPATSGRDARRIGLSEAGWTVAATVIAAMGVL